MGRVVRRQNRGYEWVGVVGRIGDDQVMGSRGDDQKIGDKHIMIN